MTEVDFKYMKEAMTADLDEILSQDIRQSIPQTLEALYNSNTYSKLTDPASGLYFQSPKYVYSFLRSEMTTGIMS